MLMSESQWQKFVELVEGLKEIPPRAREALLRNLHARRQDPEVLALVERRLKELANGQSVSATTTDLQRLVGALDDLDLEKPGGPPGKLDLIRCRVLLERFRSQEERLKQVQTEAARELLRLEHAKKAFEKNLKESLNADSPRLDPDEWRSLLATEEEVLAGLQEIKDHGGLEFDEFVQELEQVVQDGERTGT